MLWIVALIGGVVVLAALTLVGRRRRTAAPTPALDTALPAADHGIAEMRPVGVSEVVARLAVGVDDPERPSVQRLARELAEQAFAASGRVERVVVQDARGRDVLTVPRRERPTGPAPALPDRVRVDTGRPNAPHPRSRATLAVTPRLAEDVSVPIRTLLDRIQLPDVVRAGVRHPDDSVDVIRAILVAGGHDVHVHDGTLIAGDTAVVVVADPHGTAAALGRAFLRFQHSGARFGIVVHTGYVDPAELRRRDALVPQLVYVGPAAIQRMADAVELGLDPLVAARGVTATPRA